MTPAEAARVLAAAASFDQRTVGQADVSAWHAALVEIDYNDALAAVVRHYRTTTERIMPVHVVRQAGLLADERRWAAEHEGVIWETTDGHEYEPGDHERCRACGLPQPNRRHRRVSAASTAASAARRS